MELFETGIPPIDAATGGLGRAKLYALHGETGTGKSVLGLQFIAAGVEQRQCGVYLTAERPADLVQQADAFGFRLAEAVRFGLVAFLEFDPDASVSLLQYGMSAFTDRLRAELEGRKECRLVIDSIDPLFCCEVGQTKLRYNLRYLAETLEEWQWTTLLLADEQSWRAHPTFPRVCGDVAAGVFRLERATEEGHASRHLEIEKLRGLSHELRRVRFQILPEKGIVLDEESLAGQRMPVLVADRDEAARAQLVATLESEFEVLQAADGVEALAVALSSRPAVLLVAASLGKLTGIEVCRGIRRAGLSQPIYLLGEGQVRRGDRIVSILAGADDYLSKPVNPNELLAKVRLGAAASRNVVRHKIPDIDIESLVAQARAASLEPHEFREKLGEASRLSAQLQLPFVLAAFSRKDHPRTPVEHDPWVALRKVLASDLRTQDAVCFEGHDRALALFVNCDVEGSRIVFARLWDRVRRELPESVRGLIGEEILQSSRVILPPPNTQDAGLAPELLIMHAFNSLQPVDVGWDAGSEGEQYARGA